jgi:hypothetical protein
MLSGRNKKGNHDKMKKTNSIAEAIAVCNDKIVVHKSLATKPLCTESA